MGRNRFPLVLGRSQRPSRSVAAINGVAAAIPSSFQRETALVGGRDSSQQVSSKLGIGETQKSCCPSRAARARM